MVCAYLDHNEGDDDQRHAQRLKRREGGEDLRCAEALPRRGHVHEGGAGSKDGGGAAGGDGDNGQQTILEQKLCLPLPHRVDGVQERPLPRHELDRANAHDYLPQHTEALVPGFEVFLLHPLPHHRHDAIQDEDDGHDGDTH
jgi:hypothetical protein